MQVDSWHNKIVLAHSWLSDSSPKKWTATVSNLKHGRRRGGGIFESKNIARGFVRSLQSYHQIEKIRECISDNIMNTLPPNSSDNTNKIPLATSSFLVAIRPTATAGFRSPPVKCPMASTKVAMLRPAVSATTTTFSTPSVDAQTRKTKMAVHRDSAKHPTKTPRFVSSLQSKHAMTTTKRRVAWL